MAFPFSEAILQCGQPAKPPALLPVPVIYLPAPEIPVYRVDDRGQGLLFDAEPDAKVRRKRGKAA